MSNKCNYCYGDEAVFWKDEQNNAFVDSNGEMMVTVEDNLIRFKVDSCPMCGRRFDIKEDYLSIGANDDIWYADYENGTVEHGIISSIDYKGGKVDCFSVTWDEGDFDVYDGFGLGRHYFIKQSNALQELREQKHNEER